MRRYQILILCLCATAGLMAQSPASRPAVGERDFDASMKSIAGQMASGKWKDAQTALKKLLEKHEGADYAIARRSEIAESLKRCAFRVSCPPPDPKRLVKGNLLSWDPGTGKIRIRYQGMANSDFHTENGVQAFPAAFAGPHVIEIKGDSYTGFVNTPVAVICASKSKTYQISFGFPPREGFDKYLPGRIFAIDDKGGDGEKLAEKDKVPCKDDKPYTFKIDVGMTSIAVSYAGSSYLKATKPSNVWGYFGFKGLTPSEITIEGKIEPSWIQNQVDAIVAEQLSGFEKVYDPILEVPQWLLKEKAPAVARGEAVVIAPYPANPSASETQKLEDLLRPAVTGQGKKIAERVAAMTDAELSPPHRHYVLAICALETGRYEAAENHILDIERSDPKWPGVHTLRSRMFLEQGKLGQAITSLERAVDAAPGDTESYLMLATLNLRENRPDEARKTITRAKTNGADDGGSGKVFEMMLTSIDKMTRGPDWLKTFDSRSTNYHVFSDIDKSTCATAAQLLEEALMIYSGRLRAVPKGGPAFRVYLFSGQAGYAKYCASVVGSRGENTAGMYSPIIKQLMIWNLPVRAEMMRTVLHEGFHQYLDRLCPGEIPTWFNEGSAVYFENAGQVNGSWTTGQIDDNYMVVAKDIVKANKFEIERFLVTRPPEFYRNARENYAKAWSFVHFLRHSTPDNKKIYDGFFNALADGTPPSQAIPKFFPSEKRAAMEDEYREHVWRAFESMRK